MSAARTFALVAVVGAAGVVVILAIAFSRRDEPVGSAAEPYPIAYIPPRGYVCYRAPGSITMDGRIDELAWQAAPWSEDFVDIEGDVRPTPRHRTRVKMLWNDAYFYVAAQLDEPHVQASFTEHDSYIFHEDNDFEVFIDPDGTNHSYVELEMNALNTTWDLMLTKPYHAHGLPLDRYEIEGLKTAVHIDGTLNDPRDQDRGWTIELALPWKTLAKLTTRSTPPKDGSQWRVNFSRVQWQFDAVDGRYVRRANQREDNWVWSPQGAINMHLPERWGYVQFSTAPPGTATFQPDAAGPAIHLLHRVYHGQRAYLKRHGRYATALAELNLPDLEHESLAAPLQMTTGADGWNATVEVRTPGGGRRGYRIRQDARLETVAGEPSSVSRR